MSNHQTLAQETFSQSFSCAQAVFLPFALERGLSREQALKTSGAFGAGMGRLQETCGAVTGAFMALGMETGQTQAGDGASKTETYRRVQLLAREFTARHGSTCCRTLLGLDLNTPEGQKEFADRGLHSHLCAALVTTGVELTEKIMDGSLAG